MRIQKKNHYKQRLLLVSLSLVLLGLLSVGGTLAWLHAQSVTITNTFQPTTVTTEVDEDFNGTAKTKIAGKNTGNTDAYIRIRLVSYRINEAGNPIGGNAAIPAFTMADGWFQANGNYYYKHPVAPNTSTPNLLQNGSLALQQYTDADGGKQVIEVLVEAIQANPIDAAQAAWGKAVANQLLPAQTSQSSNQN